MSDNNWNRKQCLKIANWLSKRKKPENKLIAEWCSHGSCEIRLFATPLDLKPHLVIRIADRIHLFMDTPHKIGNRLCCCKAELYDTLKEWYFNDSTRKN